MIRSDWSAALCAQSDPDAWFPDDGDRHGARLAARICGGCPVRADCLEAALERGEQHGIWGGTTPRERLALRQAARRTAA